MAQPIERKEVQDILAPNPNSNASAPQLGQMAVRNPNQSGGSDWIDGQNAIQSAVAKIATGVAKKADQAKDDQITEGRLKYMQGVTKEEIIQSGDQYTMQGYQAMESATSANDFVLGESLRIVEEDYKLTPEQYRTEMLQRRADRLKGLDDDPVNRKMWADQFDNTAGKMIAEQTIKHNEYLKGKNEEALSNQLLTTSQADPNAGRVMPGSTLRVSPGVVSTPMKSSAYDRDIGIRTMLGEAANQGEQGMAGVAHVLKNRATREGFGGKSIAEVALAENQFSTWNADINTATKFVKGSPAYERAGRVYDLVMAGRVADFTGGADHYYSPKGMKEYQKQGIATYKGGDVPKWAMGKNISAKLGGHLFYNLSGKSAGIPTGRDDRQQGDVVLPPFSDPADVAAVVTGRDDRAPTPQPSAQDILINNPLVPPRRKAEIAGNLMIDQLRQGNDDLYEELGGTTTLRTLGLPETEIAKVESALNEFKAKQANEFNIADERQKDDIYQKVLRGDMTAEEGGAELQAMVDRNSLTDAQARALQQSYFQAEREGDQAFIENPDLQAELAQLQINLSARQGEEGFMTLEEGMKHAAEMAKRYGIPPKKMESVTQSLVNTAKSRVISERERIRAAGERYAKNKLKAAEANKALAAGYGLDALSGSITIHTADGVEKEITLKDYAIDQLKQGVLMQARSMIGRGGGPGTKDAQTGRTMTADDAATWANREIAAKLVRHGVVDPVQKQMVTAALTGQIIGPDGKVSEDSLQAMDYLMTLAADPRIGMEEAIKYVGSTSAAAMAATVMDMTATNVSLPDALHRANETLNGKAATATLPPVKELEARREVSEKFEEIRNSITEDSSNSLRGWAAYVFGTKTLEDSQYKLIDQQADGIKARVEAKTRATMRLHPNMPASAAVKLAIAQNANEAVVLNGQIVYGDPNKKQRLDQIMGLDGMRHAPDDAVKYWLEKHYTNILGQDEVGKAVLRNQETWWQKTKRVAGGVKDVADAAVRTAARAAIPGTLPFDAKAQDELSAAAEQFRVPKLPYYTTVDERTGILTISYYDPSNEGKTLVTRYANLRDIGKEYKEDYINSSGLFGDITLKAINAGKPLWDATPPGGMLTSPIGTLPLQ